MAKLSEYEFKLMLLIAIRTILEPFSINPESVLEHIWPIIQEYIRQNDNSHN